MSEVKKKYLPQNVTFVLCGDFNEDTSHYAAKQVFNELDPYSPRGSHGNNGVSLNDTKRVSKQKHQGERNTFTGWSLKRNAAHMKIDYIFVNKEVTVLNHATIGDTFGENNSLASDHRPVASKIIF